MKGTWDAGSDPLEALRDGDPGPFDDFVVSEASSFVAFFLRLGARREEAKDLTQDVFLKLFRHAATYSPDGRFSAFALRVARNAWIDHTRRSAVRPAPAAGAGGSPDEGEELEARVPSFHPAGDGSTEAPGAQAERDEEARQVMRALESLSDGHRLVFELGVVQELPYPQIAELLSIPVGTVKSRMHHAVRKLRELLPGLDPAVVDAPVRDASSRGEAGRINDPSLDLEREGPR